jgi:peptidoglycan hydrolase CwlO-like protein
MGTKSQTSQASIRSYNKKATAIEKRVLVLEEKQEKHDNIIENHHSDITEIKASINELKSTAAKWSGGILVGGFVLTLLANIVANMVQV